MRTKISDCIVKKRNGMWEYRVYFYEKGEIPVIVLTSEKIRISDALFAAARSLGEAA